MDRQDVFISYNSQDKDAALELDDQLRSRGFHPWIYVRDAVPGQRWQDQLERIIENTPAVLVLVGGSGLGPWEAEEVAGALQQAVDRKVPVIPIFLKGAPPGVGPESLPLFLRSRVAVDLRTESVDRLVQGLGKRRDLERTDEAASALEAGEQLESERPYQALDPFREADAHRFFGRRHAVDEFVDELRDKRLLTLLGASGSGKSSLMLAGLLPAVRTGEVDGSFQWTLITMRPDRRPCHQLARCLLQARGKEASARNLDELRVYLLANPAALSDEVDLMLEGNARLLLAVDQLEEIFTRAEEEHRDALVAALLHAVGAEDGRVTVVSTLRADFIGRAMEHSRELASAVKSSGVFVVPMTKEELRDAVEKPAGQAGLKLEAGLTETLVRETAGQPGDLPLLEFTLDMLWRERDGRTLTWEAYNRHGGLRGAIAHRADAFFEGLEHEAERAAVGQIFGRLVRFGEEGPSTRRRASREELAAAGGEPSDRLVEALVSERLLSSGEEGVEVAHEALIREWPRLREWVEENREAWRLQEEISRDVASWEESGRSADRLWRGGRLARLRELVEQGRARLTPLEEELLRESEVAELFERQQKLHAAQRFSQLVAVACFVVAFFAVVAGFQWRNASRAAETATRAAETAKRQTREANQNLARVFEEIASDALNGARETHRSVDYQRSLLASLEALRLAEGAKLPPSLGRVSTPEIAYEAFRQLWQSPATSQVLSVAFSPDGKRLASGSEDRSLRIWDVESGAALATWSGHQGEVLSVAFSPNGKRLVSGSEDQRIRIWDVENGEALATWSGHQGEVLSVAFSPDGKRLASGSRDQSIRIWDVESGAALATWSGHQSAVSSVAFSPDSKRLASGSEDQSIRIWDVESGEALATWSGHRRGVSSIAFSPDGKRLASGSEDRSLRIWDVESGAALATWSGHRRGVSSVAFSPDGKCLASGSEDRSLRIWDVESGEALATWSGHQGPVLSVAFSPDSKRLASGSEDQSLRIWDVESGEALAIWGGHRVSVWDVAFSPDGKRLASGSSDGSIHIWDVESGEALATWSGHRRGSCLSVAFSPDGKRVASGCEGHLGLRIWDVESGEALATWSEHQGRGQSVAFSPDGKLLASGSSDQRIRIWDVESGEAFATWSGHQGPVWSVAFSPDGKLLASGSEDKRILIWDVESGEALATCRGHQGRVSSVAFSPDGKRLASGSYDVTIRIWDVESGEPFDRWSGQDKVSSVAFSPDGKRLVSGSWGEVIRIWDVESGEALATWSHESEVLSVAFSPDGKRLASGSEDQSVRTWDVESGKTVATLGGKRDWVTSVAFSPNGNRFASGSDDESIRIWDVESGEALASLSGHQDAVWSVAFSPDGKLLASGSDDESIRIWDVESSEALATWNGHHGVLSLVFSPDGNRLASGSEDRNIRIWDVESGETVVAWSGHQGPVWSVAYSPDGKHLASGSEDQSIRIWDIESGEALAIWNGHKDLVSSVAYSPDGKRLASGSRDQSIRIWDVESGEALATLSEHQNRVMSVAFSRDGMHLASGSWGPTIRTWDLTLLELLLEPNALTKLQRLSFQLLPFRVAGYRLEETQPQFPLSPLGDYQFPKARDRLRFRPRPPGQNPILWMLESSDQP